MEEMKVTTKVRNMVMERFKDDPTLLQEWMELVEKYKNDSTPLGLIGAEMRATHPRSPQVIEEVIDAWW